MKKSSILFLSAFVLLAGCTPNHKESSEESKAPLTLDETLEKLKGGYHLDLLVTSTYQAVQSSSGSKTVYKGYEEIYGDSTKYRHLVYNPTLSGDPDKSVVNNDYLYAEENKNIVQHTLSLANTISSTPVEGKSWSSSFLKNAFTVFKKENFEEKDGAYVFKKGNNLAAAKFMGSQLRGYPRSSDSFISSMVLTMNEDGSVSFKAELEKYTVTYITDISVSTVYEGSFVSMGESVQDIQTINKEENKTFQEAMKKIATLNFDAKGVNYEIKAKDGRYEQTESVVSSAWDNGFTYRFLNSANKVSEEASYVMKDSKIQRLALYDGTAYLSGKPTKANVTDFWPTYAISSAFFNEKDGVFTLDSKYLGMFSTTSIYTPFVSDAIKTLTIKLENDKVTFTSTNEGNGRTIFGAKEEMIFTNFGKKSAPVYQIKEDSSELTWDQIIRDENAYVSAVEDLGGKAILNAVPTFGGIYSEGGYGSSQDGLSYVYARISSLEEGKELSTAYGPKLEKNGFLKNEETDTDGTYTVYTKTIGKKQLILEPILGTQTDAITGQKYYVFLVGILAKDIK